MTVTVAAVKALVREREFITESVRINQVIEVFHTDAGSTTAVFEMDHHSQEF